MFITQTPNVVPAEIPEQFKKAFHAERELFEKERKIVEDAFKQAYTSTGCIVDKDVLSGTSVTLQVLQAIVQRIRQLIADILELKPERELTPEEKARNLKLFNEYNSEYDDWVFAMNLQEQELQSPTHAKMQKPVDPYNLAEELQRTEAFPKPDRNERRRMIIRTQFCEKTVAGDGNCFLECLKRLLKLETSVETLRQDIVKFMRENPERYSNSCRESPRGGRVVNITYTEFLEKLSQNGTYFERGAIQAAADCFKANILIYSPGYIKVENNKIVPMDTDPDDPILEGNIIRGIDYSEGGPVIHLYFYIESKHYNVLEPLVSKA